MFMRYWGGGIGHQHEGARWKIADRGIVEDKMDVDSEPDDPTAAQSHPNQDLQLGSINQIAIQLQADENAGAETDDSQSSHSSDSVSSEDPYDRGTDDDEDDDHYFGPEDVEQIFDFDSDG